ncbi:MAG: hypothetical protein GXC73_09240 [Chitinophagaceae bacterium]|nr:hypothetical protein [Chitinophagaceae bacterium]
MPVVISEIQITAYVNETGNKESRQERGRSEGEKKDEVTKKESLVKICVEEVLRILKEKEER